MSFLKRSSIIRNVAVLASATALAQGITFLVAPLLTRLFTPADYGVLAIYNSILALFLVVSSLRFELGIPLPKEDAEGEQLLLLSLFIVLATSCLLGLCLPFIDDYIVTLTNLPALKPYLLFLPLSIIGAGSYQVLTFWAIRIKAFNSLAQTKMTQSVGQAAIQLIMGIPRTGVTGLLAGQLVGDLAASGTLMFTTLRNKSRDLRKFSLSDLTGVALRYKNFPLFSTTAKFLSVATMQLPPLCLAIFYGAETAGFFALAQRMVLAPVTLLGTSIGNVFWSEASSLIHEDPARLKCSFIKASRNLGLFGLGLGAILIFGPWLFTLIFGEPWREAGIFARNLALLFMTQIVVGPLSILPVHELQHWEFWWNLFCLVGTAVLFWLVGIFELAPNLVVILWGSFMGIANLFLFALNIIAFNRYK